MAKKTAKKLLNQPRAIVLTFSLALILIIVLAALIPIERMRYSGGCRSKDHRLSLILDGQQKVRQATEKVEKMNLEREERLKINPLLEGGCSQGLSYAIYIL